MNNVIVFVYFVIYVCMNAFPKARQHRFYFIIGLILQIIYMKRFVY